MSEEQVLLGIITGAHGVRGGVKIKSFTAEPEAIADYGPVTDETGKKSYSLNLTGSGKGFLLAEIDGVTDRNAAEALKGTKLFIARELLPETEEEEYYHADLIGLSTYLVDGDEVGKIRAVYDFGSGDMLEIEPLNGRVFLVPFTREAVPVVDIKAKRVEIVPSFRIEDNQKSETSSGNAK